MSNLKATKRENKSSGFTNKLRAKGFIPAILYGGSNPNQSISVEKKDFLNIIRSESFLSKVLEIDIEGKKEKVLPRDVSYHVISDEPIHIDFMRIVAGKKIGIEVPVHFKNHSESPGLKRGGVLNIVRRKIEFKCPADAIPDKITIDLIGTDIGTSIKISSVKLPSNVVPTITDRDFVIATVAAPTVIKEPEKPAEEVAAEGAEGDAAATTSEGAEGTPSKEAEGAKKDDKGKATTDKNKPAAGDKKTAAPAGKKPPEKK